MTDQELLYLSAKAYCRGTKMFQQSDSYRMGFLGNWNPLNDNSQALKLAFDLGLHILCDEADSIDTVRRDIVTAAADIGKSMEKSQ